LVGHGGEVLKSCIDSARPYPVQGIYEVVDVADKVDHLYHHGLKPGEFPGWDTVAEYYTVRPGEWTLVTGIPGHGKSEFVDALMVNLAKQQEWTFGIFSPENQPIERHIAKLAEKHIEKPFREGPSQRMTPDELQTAKLWVNEHFSFILPDEDSMSLESVLELAKTLVFRKGIKGLVIDPWNELDHSRPANLSETEYISKCLTRIRQFARCHGVHVWLVAHPTKLQKDKDGTYPVPTAYDVSGSAHWRNKADNALSIWRNPMQQDSTVQVHVQKIRFKEIGKVGMVELRYNYLTGVYSENVSNYLKPIRSQGGHQYG